MLDWADQTERALLSRFPKTRERLPPEYEAFHETFYKAAREGQHAGASIALKLEEWMHKRAIDRPTAFPLLEIGAGTLNHVRFESPNGTYDVVEPMKSLYEGKSEISRVGKFYSDIAEIEPGSQYKRIISIATFEHILNAPEVVARSSLLLAPGGEFRAGIPSEGGLLWYLAYMFGTGVTFRLKYGLSYARFQQYEHVNKAWEIEGLLRIFFEEVAITRWPISTLHTSFYTHLAARKPRTDVARQYLSALAAGK